MDASLEQFRETTSTDAFALQSSKLLEVRLEEVTIRARAGAMVAYQGDVSFRHAGSGGLGRLLREAATGEGLTLMEMSGRGEVLLADAAQDVHRGHLEDDSLTVNTANLLAFGAGIEWDIERVEGEDRSGGGGGLSDLLDG